MFYSGIEKIFNPAYPLGIWIEMWLVWGFAQWASEQEMLLVRQGNLLSPDSQTGIFSSPDFMKKKKKRKYFPR